ncbi:unnamed protein product [Chrysodeixis includens]|uniref:Uncharacterized protein n=1 Tax=Chrysodeixis includens TaxID=689277 RepID=A0A9P0BQY6_CHRIL|nr:unnamed protein product [Chrysodeixis includens]
MSLSPNSSILQRTIDLKYEDTKRSTSLKWIVVNIVLFLLFVYDLCYKCPGYTSALHYVEMCAAGVLGANAVQHALRLRGRARAPPSRAAAARLRAGRRPSLTCRCRRGAGGRRLPAAQPARARAAPRRPPPDGRVHRRLPQPRCLSQGLRRTLSGRAFWIAAKLLGTRPGHVLGALPARGVGGGGRGRGRGRPGRALAAGVAAPAAGPAAPGAVEPQPAPVAARHHPAAAGARAGRRGRGAGGGRPGRRARGRRQCRAPARRRRPAARPAAHAAGAARLPRTLRRPTLRRAAHQRTGAGRVPERLPLERRRLGVGRGQADGRGAGAAAAGHVPGRAAAAGRGAQRLQQRAPVGGAGARAARAGRAGHPPRERAPAALRAGAGRRHGGGVSRPQQPAALAAAVHSGGGARGAARAAPPAPGPRRTQHAVDHRPVTSHIVVFTC